MKAKPEEIASPAYAGVTEGARVPFILIEVLSRAPDSLVPWFSHGGFRFGINMGLLSCAFLDRERSGTGMSLTSRPAADGILMEADLR